MVAAALMAVGEGDPEPARQAITHQNVPVILLRLLGHRGGGLARAAVVGWISGSVKSDVGGCVTLLLYVQ